MSNSNNTNNNQRNVYTNNTQSGRSIEGAGSVTTINIENDTMPSTSHHLQQQQQQRQYLQQQQQHANNRRNSSNSTRIAMDGDAASNEESSNANHSSLPHEERFRNLLSIVRDVRFHFRGNLYDVLSTPGAPRTDTLRTIFTRYNSVPTSDSQMPEDNFHFLLNQHSVDAQQQPLANRSGTTETQSLTGLRLSRNNSRLDDRSITETSASSPLPQSPQGELVPEVSNGGGGGGSVVSNSSSRRQSGATTTGGAGTARPAVQRQASHTGSTTPGSTNAAPTIDMMDDPDNNAMGELIVKLVSHFMRYFPFICILFVKFIHDHLLGIIDLLFLHGIMYHVNKTLKEQIAKLNQKSYIVLVRDLFVVIFVVTYRFLLATTAPDPFGLLITPPHNDNLTNQSSSSKTNSENGSSNDMFSNYFSQISVVPVSKLKDEVPSSVSPILADDNIASVVKSLSLGVLIYYVAINDLVVKLLTQSIKLVVTTLPMKVIRHKSRARLYALVEYVSQFYRALVPMRQWLFYLYGAYTGVEVLSGVLFSSFYLGAKGFELIERGKSLKKALVNFVRNMDYDRKPTKDELEAAGTLCPICHDAYTTPVVLECGHIFCDECVNTWFKREQTCPMCRAKVSEDPTWQDGATSFFYQLF